MTSNHKGRRAETVRLQNVSTTNPAQLWLAGLAPAGRKGMQSQPKLCRYPASGLGYRQLPLADAELHGGDAGALGAAE